MTVKNNVVVKSITCLVNAEGKAVDLFSLIRVLMTRKAFIMESFVGRGRHFVLFYFFFLIQEAALTKIKTIFLFNYVVVPVELGC